MDPLGTILIVVVLVLGTLSLMTRRSVDRATRKSRHRAFRFARLALRTWVEHQRGGVPEDPPDSLLEAARLIRRESKRRGVKEPKVVSALLMPTGVKRLEALASLAPCEELNSVDVPPTLDPDRNSLDGFTDNPSYEGVTDPPPQEGVTASSSGEGISERDDPFELPEFLKSAATSR